MCIYGFLLPKHNRKAMNKQDEAEPGTDLEHSPQPSQNLNEEMRRHLCNGTYVLLCILKSYMLQA